MSENINKEKLEQVIKGEISAQYDFFAFKILLTRVQNTFKQEPEKLDECVLELSEFCNQHEDNPQFQDDMDKLKG